MIILDFGSGNTCKNDKTYIKRMYDELKAVDAGKQEIVCKWQLFKEAGNNISLTHDCFKYAYEYGTNLGYPVTSSVFDKESLDFLLGFDVPFIKIANNRNLDWLANEVPRKIPLCISYKDYREIADGNAEYPLCCVSKYPCDIANYENKFYFNLLRKGISDHTTNWDLYHKYKPFVYEVHYKLEDTEGLDAGSFARTPNMLAEVL